MRIHADHQPYRKKPYVARWYEGTRQRNKFFASEAVRDDFIAQFRQTAQRTDPAFPTIEPHRLIRWQQAMAIAPDADPVEVFRFWVRAQQEKFKADERSLEDATAGYIQSMERVGRNATYIGHVKRALADLCDELSDKLVRDITSTELAEHLFGLPVSDPTDIGIRGCNIKRKKYFLQYFRVIYSCCVVVGPSFTSCSESEN